LPQPSAGPALAPYKVEEVSLGPVPSNILGGTSSNDGCHVAMVVAKGGKQFVVIDGQAGPEYDGIFVNTPVFSPDGKRVAYGARTADKWRVVVDGQAGPEYEGIGGGSLLFSPDGKRVAYAAQKGGKWCVILDGQAGPEYDGIGDIVFSPDGKRVAYRAQKASKFFVVIDGQEGPEYEIVVKGGPVFRPDGTLEYMAGKAGYLFRVKHVPVE